MSATLEPPAPRVRPGEPSAPRVAWQLLRNEPMTYFIGWLQWVGFHMSPLTLGWAV